MTISVLDGSLQVTSTPLPTLFVQARSKVRRCINQTLLNESTHQRRRDDRSSYNRPRFLLFTAYVSRPQSSRSNNVPAYQLPREWTKGMRDHQLQQIEWRDVCLKTIELWRREVDLDRDEVQIQAMLQRLRQRRVE